MQKHNSVQLELFQGNESGAMAQADSSPREPRFNSLVRQYQKAIFSLVAVFFVSLVSYSFGVERGKQGALRASSSLDPVTPSAQPKVPAASENTVDVSLAKRTAPFHPGTIELKQNEKKSPAMVRESPGLGAQASTESTLAKAQKPLILKDSKMATYTVQVATIQQKKNISKELTHLKAKGYSGFDLQKGNYTVICVGKFNAAQEAKNMQQKLKGRYPDCMIRRL